MECHDDAYGLDDARIAGGHWKVPRLDIAPGKRVRMQIKARDVMIALQPPEEMSALNVIPAVVAEIGPMDGPGVDDPARLQRRGAGGRLDALFRGAAFLQPGAPVLPS